MVESQRSTEQVPVAEDDKSTKGVTRIAFGARSVSDRKVLQDVKAVIELIICQFKDGICEGGNNHAGRKRTG